VRFGVLTDRLKIALANQESMPETVLQPGDAGGAQPEQRPRAADDARARRADGPEQVAGVLQGPLRDASDFIFVFVGSFDLQTMKPLVERYLASLPSLRRNDVVRDVGAHPPSGVVQRTVRSGIEPRSQVSIVFSGAFQNDELHRVVARSMGEMLSGNLQRTLREDLGGTYGVSVEPSFTKLPTEEYRFNISLRVTRADRRPDEGGLPGDRGLQEQRADPGTGQRREIGPDEGPGNLQPAERVLPEPDSLQVRIRRGRQRKSSTCRRYTVSSRRCRFAMPRVRT
jgi:zinc protease